MTRQAALAARARQGGRAHLAIAILLAASVLGTAAQAETFVLVYVEGSVVGMPGGLIISKGDQIDGGKLIQLGPADKGVFISQSGNVVRHDGPFCGGVAQTQQAGDNGLLAPLLGNKPAQPTAAGCQK